MTNCRCRNCGEVFLIDEKNNYHVVQYAESLKYQPAHLQELHRKLEILGEAIDEIAFYGTSRPAEMGFEDDGDGHYKRIAHRCINIAAMARRQIR